MGGHVDYQAAIKTLDSFKRGSLESDVGVPNGNGPTVDNL